MNQLQVSNQNKDLSEQFTPDQLALITSTIAKGATPDELKLFLYRCNLMKLNPLKPGQIFFIKYGQGPGTIVVGIDGFRASAARSGRHASTTRGVIRDDEGNITHGWAKVVRLDANGTAQEFYEESPIAEYFNDRNPSWKKFPETMIKKVAEAAALRMAYPDDLGGVYITEEKDAIESSAIEHKTRVAPEQPNADEGSPEMQATKPYTFPFGSFQKRTPDEAFRVFGREKYENALKLLKEKIASEVPYKNVTLEDMNRAVLEMMAVLIKNKPEVIPENSSPFVFKSTEEDVPF